MAVGVFCRGDRMIDGCIFRKRDFYGLRCDDMLCIITFNNFCTTVFFLFQNSIHHKSLQYHDIILSLYCPLLNNTEMLHGKC